MSNLHDQLAAIQRHGASNYGDTSLADTHRPITRRVRRDRTVRGSVAALAGVSVAGAGTFGVLQLRMPDAVVPAGGTSPTQAGTTEIPLEDGEVPVGYDVVTTVEPGERAEAIVEQLAAAYDWSVDLVNTAVDSQLPPEADGNAEGWLAAGEHSHWLEPGVKAEAALPEHASSMVDTTVQILENNEVPRDEWQRVLTIASLVEQESQLATDMPQVARVLLNRLDDDMHLELDSTVRYSLGMNESETFISETDRATDSAYNTYVHPGLPPSPIAVPSREAIAAVLDPMKGDWTYFMTVNPNTGETKFAVEFEDHLEHVLELQEWAQENQPDVIPDDEG